MFTNCLQIVHTVFTNAKYTIIRKTDEKGGEQEFFEAYCELLYNEIGEEFEI